MLPGGLTLEALLADVQLGQVKEATKGLMEALRAVAAENPELGLAERLEAVAGVKLAAVGASDALLSSRPSSAAVRGGACSGSRAGSAVGSRPGSGRCGTPLAPGKAVSAAGLAGPGSRPGSRPSSCSGSLRSVASARQASPTKTPSVQTMQLQL